MKAASPMAAYTTVGSILKKDDQIGRHRKSDPRSIEGLTRWSSDS